MTWLYVVLGIAFLWVLMKLFLVLLDMYFWWRFAREFPKQLHKVQQDKVLKQFDFFVQAKDERNP